MPWYERADFYELWALSADQDDVPRDYERWHTEATRVMTQYLAQGRAIQFIRIKPQEFLEWLGASPNTASMRRTYVEYLAAGGTKSITYDFNTTSAGNRQPVPKHGETEPAN